MRLLEDHELPKAEQDRRKGVRDSIEWLNKEVAKAYAQAEPILVEYIGRGDYTGERLYRERLERSLEPIRRQLIYYHEQLPPYLVMRKDGFLERVPVSVGQKEETK